MSIHSQVIAKITDSKFDFSHMTFREIYALTLKNGEWGTHFISVGRLKRIKEEFFRVCLDHVWEISLKFYIPFRWHIGI